MWLRSRAGTSTPRGMKQLPLDTAMLFSGRWMPSKMVPMMPGPSSTDSGCRRQAPEGQNTRVGSRTGLQPALAMGRVLAVKPQALEGGAGGSAAMMPSPLQHSSAAVSCQATLAARPSLTMLDTALIVPPVASTAGVWSAPCRCARRGPPPSGPTYPRTPVRSGAQPACCQARQG